MKVYCMFNYYGQKALEKIFLTKGTAEAFVKKKKHSPDLYFFEEWEAIE